MTGTWTVQLSSDDTAYGGSGRAPADVIATDAPHQGQAHSFEFDVPPMSVTFFTPGP